jgi:hypothetical protein
VLAGLGRDEEPQNFPQMLAGQLGHADVDRAGSPVSLRNLSTRARTSVRTLRKPECSPAITTDRGYLFH